MSNRVIKYMKANNNYLPSALTKEEAYRRKIKELEQEIADLYTLLKQLNNTTGDK